MEVADLAPFTYLKDMDGLIFYAHGPHPEHSDRTTWVTMVYYPASTGIRRQLTTRQTYAKFVCHGYLSEVTRMATELPDWAFERLTSMMRVDPITGQQHLQLNLGEITEVYDAKESFHSLTRGLVPEFPESAISVLQEGIQPFLQAGIAETQLGFYGGLQCLLIHDGGKINDLDILVEGLSSYDTVISLSSGNRVSPETFPAFVANDPIKRAVAIRRGQVSQFRLVSRPSTVVDIRLVRSASDRVSYPRLERDALDSGVEIELRGARVVNASESLSLPASYLIQTGDGVVTISTRYYHSLGAATVGDRINARGLLTGNRDLVLLDPDRHYIVSAA